MKPAAIVLTDATIPPQSRPAVVAALRVLLKAQAFMDCSAHDPWTFAVEWQLLVAGGSSLSALRWLALNGFVKHKVESGRRRTDGRRFKVVGRLSFEERSCFVLTETGQALALQSASQEKEATEGRSPFREEKMGTAGRRQRKPRFEVKHRRLFAAGQLLHTYAPQAHNRVCVLTALQERHWPEWPKGVDDPFAREGKGDPVHRLRDAVSGINHDQEPQVLELHTIHEGTAVAWRWLTAPPRMTDQKRFKQPCGSPESPA